MRVSNLKRLGFQATWTIAALGAFGVAGLRAEGLPIDERIPEHILKAWSLDKHLVGFPNLAWDDRQVLTVAFDGGDDQVRNLVVSAANEWIAPSVPIKFSFKDNAGHWRTWSGSDKAPKAAIRIAFSTRAQDGGYWSTVGRMAEVVAPSEQTMNLGDLATALSKWGDGASPGWKRSYEHSTIVHEFGHALGLAHEHFHPECQPDLDMNKIISYLMGPPNNWSEAQARFNMDADYYFKASKTEQDQAFPKEGNSTTISPHINRASVMLYAFPDQYYQSGAASACKPSSPETYNPVASDGDLAAVKAFYPIKKQP